MEGEEGFKGLLPGRFNKTAGIDYDQVGFPHLPGVDEPVVLEQFDQRFSIDLVF